MMKRVIQSSLVVVVALFAAACSAKSENSIVGNKPENSIAENKPENLIIGKWKSSQENDGWPEMIEFFKEGSVRVTWRHGTETFTYKFLDDGHIQLVRGGEAGDPKKPEVIPVTVTGDKLTIIQINGAAQIFKRI
jgi:hypothetical protein